MTPALSQALTIIAPLLIAAVLVARNLRPRRVRVDRLWVFPALVIGVCAASLAADPPADPGILAALAGTALVGALIGWWRGALTRLDLNAGSGELTSRASPLGLALIAGLFLIRYGFREAFAASTATALHVRAATIADALIVFAAAVVAAQRLEIWLRCRKLVV